MSQQKKNVSKTKICRCATLHLKNVRCVYGKRRERKKKVTRLETKHTGVAQEKKLIENLLSTYRGGSASRIVIYLHIWRKMKSILVWPAVAMLLHNNLVLFVWSDFKCGKYKTDGNLSFSQIFVDQLRCLMFETISCYSSDFPTNGFYSDSSIDMEILVILLTVMYLFPLSFILKW